MQASLLAKLHDELRADSEGGERFAAAAQSLAESFGSVAATAVDAAYDGGGVAVAPATETAPQPAPAADSQAAAAAPKPGHCDLASLHRPGHMRRRMEQMLETHKRYGHPFALVIFDASGPGTRNGDAGGGQETVLAVVAAALRDSIRIVDEAFRLEEDAICVLAPNLGTVEGVQMAERLLGMLDELERVGGLRIAVSAGVVACPDHGTTAEELLQKADAAMWRAHAVGQPVGVGALQDR
jgi:diguanylate cyclase (GGDEF)-like protein